MSVPLFCSVWRGGHFRRDGGSVRPFSGNAVYKIVERRAHLAGLRPCTPRDLRRSVITHLLERGTDALAVQAFARHEQLSTTRYDRRGADAKRRPPAASPSRSASRWRRCDHARSAHPDTGRRVGADAPAWDRWRGGRARSSSRSPGHISATSASVRLAQSWLG